MTTTRSQSLCMSTLQAPLSVLEREIPEIIPSQVCPLSPGWIHAVTLLMGHPLTSETGQSIQKWILYQAILDYIDLVRLTQDPIQFEDSRHHKSMKNLMDPLPISRPTQASNLLASGII